MSSSPNQQVTELRELGDEELRSKLAEAKEELFNLRFQSVTGQLDNNRRLQTVRRDIARLYTVMRERELGIAPAPVAAKPDASEKKTVKKAAKAEKADSADEKSEVSA
ncbi:MAG: 50S ribosomal protein L29 [Corynebacteriales bacterium]|nr:50S ribosomal protein L29 [Mycobacteriales bacterium]